MCIRDRSGSVLHTILLTGLCFAGFGFMMNCANQLTLEERQKETVFSIILESKLPQAILIFVSTCYLIEFGVSINIWILIGILAWALFCHFALGICLAQKGRQISILAWKMLTLVIILIGAIQTVFLIFNWLNQGHFIVAACALLVALSCCALWVKDIPSVISGSRQTDEQALF